MMQEILKRIEEEAKAFEDKNPYDAIHSAYYMGAKSERNKTIDDCIKILSSTSEVNRLLTSLKVDL